VLIVPTFGALTLANRLRAAANDGPAWVVRLFQNDYIPTLDTTAADLIEPTWPGYGAKTLFFPSAAELVDGEAVLTAAPVNWVCLIQIPPQPIYGYWVQIDGVFFAAERVTPKTWVEFSGQAYWLTLRLTNTSKYG